MKTLLALIAFALVAHVKANVCQDELFSFLPHPDRCESFIMCMMDRPITLTCDGNFIWDQTRRRCRLGSHHTCEFRFGPEPSCEDQVFSIHYREDSCTEFFMCMVGRRIDFQCDAGQIFDSYSRACVAGDSFLCIPDDGIPYKKN